MDGDPRRRRGASPCGPRRPAPARISYSRQVLAADVDEHLLSHSIAWAAIRQPSISRCGTRAITCRSLNAPGSDSSALTTRYFGFGLCPIDQPPPCVPSGSRHRRGRAASRPAGVDEPPRASSRARSARSYPPTARYSASFVRSRSWCRPGGPRAPARISSTISADVVRASTSCAVAVVDRDHGRVAAAPRHSTARKRDVAVLGRLARRDPELASNASTTLPALRRARTRGSCRPRSGAPPTGSRWNMS